MTYAGQVRNRTEVVVVGSSEIGRELTRACVVRGFSSLNLFLFSVQSGYASSAGISFGEWPSGAVFHRGGLLVISNRL